MKPDAAFKVPRSLKSGVFLAGDCRFKRNNGLLQPPTGFFRAVQSSKGQVPKE
jgi:hypothetical protein